MLVANGLLDELASLLQSGVAAVAIRPVVLARLVGVVILVAAVVVVHLIVVIQVSFLSETLYVLAGLAVVGNVWRSLRHSRNCSISASNCPFL